MENESCESLHNTYLWQLKHLYSIYEHNKHLWQQATPPLSNAFIYLFIYFAYKYFVIAVLRVYCDTSNSAECKCMCMIEWHNI